MQPGSLANFIALCVFLFLCFAALALWNFTASTTASTRGGARGSGSLGGRGDKTG